MIRLIIFLKPFAKYLFAGWLFIIIYVSSIPSIPTLMIRTEGSEIRLDYMMHFCEYGLLAFLAFLSFVNSEFKMNLRKYLITAACLIVLAVLDELHQKLIPGRSFNVEDILSNVTGILAGLIFCSLIFRKIARRLKEPS